MIKIMGNSMKNNGEIDDMQYLLIVSLFIVQKFITRIFLSAGRLCYASFLLFI